MKHLYAYYLFSKSPIPQITDEEIGKVVRDLKKNHTKESYLKHAYDYITTHHLSGRIDTLLKLTELYSVDTQSLWNRRGFMHCTNQNYLLAVLLVTGGYFDESDISPKWTLIGFYSPHQYLKIRLGENSWVEVDCWARQYGVGFGRHAYGFNTTLRRSFVK